MDLDEEREKIGKFIKAGLFGLSLVLLLGCGFIYLPNVIETFQSSEKEQKSPINSVECLEKKVALSFDVTGDGKALEAILSKLEEHKVEAAFFITEQWAEEYPDMVRKINAAGHDLGNHGVGKESMAQLSVEECQEKMIQVHNSIKEIAGVDMKLFRAPYGDFGETVLDASELLGYLPIKWNIDSMDWKDYGTDSIINAVCNSKELKEGSIILCHSDTKFTKNALDNVIDTLQAKGYSFVKISEMVYSSDYRIDENGRQKESL